MLSEFMKILNNYGNRMDKAELLENGDELLGITTEDGDYDSFFVNGYKGKFFRTYVDYNDGISIHDTYEVYPEYVKRRDWKVVEKKGQVAPVAPNIKS